MVIIGHNFLSLARGGQLSTLNCVMGWLCARLYYSIQAPKIKLRTIWCVYN
jgi:hypothetical protein